MVRSRIGIVYESYLPYLGTGLTGQNCLRKHAMTRGTDSLSANLG
jgi:hypothetical protein